MVDTRKADAIFRGMVARLIAEDDTTRITFAQNAGFSEPHLRRMLDDPGTARLDDVRGIVAAYDVSDAELVAIVRGCRREEK